MMMMMVTAMDNNKSQKGAALVGLLAFMTLVTITLLAVAPNIVQEVQRSKEEESIRRGEEVADAIRQYVIAYGGAKLPNSMDDLLEGIPQGTKKRQILRASAAIDPLSEDGKWRLVKTDSKSLINFGRRVQNYNGGVLPANPSQVFDRFAFALVNSLNTETEEELKDVDSSEDVDDETENVQFIAVVSKSKSRSIIAYYGIENHSKWIFTPLFRGQGIGSAIQKRNGAFDPPPLPPQDPNIITN
jgi:type II secretory pathway pseudopilin PulG